MKKVLAIILSALLVLGACACFTACTENKKESEIAVVTDVGQLKDGGFNEGTYEGAKAYAEANGKTYKYYQPANGSAATDNDRIAAMNQAINNGAKVIVAPGYLQATAMTTVATQNPTVKFIFIDGLTLTDAKRNALTNVTVVTYKEQESGFLAGYAAVREGYTKLGATLGGGGNNPACNRFGFGFIQGAEAAAKMMNLEDGAIQMKYSFKYGDAFSASTELQTQISGWYTAGTQVVFSCGGSMFESVKAAAESKGATAKIIGVDVDQSSLSNHVITSAVKGLKESVQLILTEYYAGNWDTKLAGKTSNLGASDNATGLPTATWSMTKFTVTEYNALFAQIANGTLTVSANAPDDCNNTTWLTALGLTKVAIDFEA